MKNKKPNQTQPFILLRGVVEDNIDPLKIGRVRVRIFGVHIGNNENSGAKFEFIKTSELPWAEVMGGTGFGLVGGVGLSSVLHQGTWVWVMLENNDSNKPVVLGTIHGVNSESPIGKAAAGAGFYDPAGKFPPPPGVGRSDMNHRLDDAYTTMQVIETQSGHVVEIQDTPGSERIKVTHKTGTYFYIDPAGNIFVNCVANINYDIAGDVTWKVGGNTDWKVAGNFKVTAKRIDLN